tara:strand:+ start:2072 stop:2536 length:465 start_codon:yes stop_codon:yes gene_type:complete
METIQKTVFKPNEIDALQDNWLNCEVEHCWDCKGTLMYISPTKGLIYDFQYKILKGNIYRHIKIEDVGFNSVCAECGSHHLCLTKVDDRFVIEEYDDFHNMNQNYVEDMLDIISGRSKEYIEGNNSALEKLKKKIDDWIERNKIEDPYVNKKSK